MAVVVGTAVAVAVEEAAEEAIKTNALNTKQGHTLYDRYDGNDLENLNNSAQKHLQQLHS